MLKLKSPLLAVDGAVLEKGKLLLVKRAIEPFRDYWVLPGGHVEYGETVEKAIKREMKEELGVNVKIEGLLGVYSDPKRDPRCHTVSVTFLLKKERGQIRLNGEASEFRFFKLDEVPSNIGFDHKKAISDIRKRLKTKK